MLGDPEFDIIIVGAGPAGAPMAFCLKIFDTSRKLNVLLLEKKEDADSYIQYHHKCGEGVSEKFLHEIYPLQAQPDDIIMRVPASKEYWPEHSEVTSKLSECILNRPIFLRHIIQSYQDMGGIVRWDEMLNITDTDTCVQITCKSGYKTSTRLLIGADGPNSRTRKCCKFEEPMIVTVMQYLIPAESNEDNAIRVWYDEKYHGGYKYMFPYGNGKKKIGFVLGTDAYNGPIIELQAKQIAFGGMTRYLKNHVMLIGDAAGQANPFTGGGIKPCFIAAKKLSSFLNKSSRNSKQSKTIALINAAKRFETWWQNSGYDSRKYLAAYEKFKTFNNTILAKFSNPFTARNPIAMILALMKNMRFYTVYKAFINSARFS